MAEASNLRLGRNSPIVDYTSADFAGLKADLITYMQANFADRWTVFNDSEFAVALIDAVAYVGDVERYHLDATLRELLSPSVLRRANLRRIMQPFGMEPEPATCSAGTLRVVLNPSGTYPFTITTAMVFSDDGTNDPVYYSPVSDTTVAAYDAGGASFTAVEGEGFADQLIGVSSGKPLQKWQFPQDNVVVASLTLRVGAAVWTRVENLGVQGSDKRVYRVQYSDDGNVFACFGDGTHGAIPPAAQSILATGRAGGGSRGNKRALGLIRAVVVGHPSILTVGNTTEFSGGTDPQSLRDAKNAIPEMLHTLGDRAVSTADYASVAGRVPGVAKTRAYYSGGRVTTVVLAPAGGGMPSEVLKVAVSERLRTARIAGRKTALVGPVYRDLRQQYLLHVNPAFRASDVQSLFQSALTNERGTGLFDFNQMDFAGVDEADEPFVSNKAVQALAETLVPRGLDRVEIVQMDVAPLARPREGGNSGDGVVDSIQLSGRQRRREFFVRMTSSATAIVYERILGTVYSMTDTSLTDDEKVFEGELALFGSFAGWKLAPDASAPASTVDVVGAAGQAITTTGASLFSMTSRGEAYFMFNPVGVVLNVKDTYTSGDGSVAFRLTDGSSPFLAGDSFSLDVYPFAGDITLRFDEYPRLSFGGLVIRPSGGARV